LNRMATLLAFDSSGSSPVRSVQPFAQEWQRLQDKGAVNKVRKLNLLALKSSHMEQFIPRAFQLVFASAVLALIIIVATTAHLPNTPPRGPNAQTHGAK